MATYYRLHTATRNHAEITDPEQWESHVLGGGRWITDESGAEIEDVRHGVSACESIEELASYMACSGACPEDPVLVIFDGDRAAEDDHDADLGAVLTEPHTILGVFGEGTPEWDAFDADLDAALGWAA